MILLFSFILFVRTFGANKAGRSIATSLIVQKLQSLKHCHLDPAQQLDRCESSRIHLS